MKNYKVIIVDDDIKLGLVLKEYLETYGHSVDHHADSTTALDLIQKRDYSLVILDIMMPEVDGFELCKKIRAISQIPILFLSARGETTDKIIGLELGADDFLAKPFEPRELLARIDSIMRRFSSQGIQKKNFGELSMDPNSLTATYQGTDLDLTSNEFLALNYLVSNKHKIVNRDEILTFMQGFDTEVYGRSIDILVSRIRQKLGDNSKNPKFIKTVRGQGYRFIGGE